MNLKVLLISLLSIWQVNAFGQNISVKTVKMLPSDVRARTNPRTTKDGKDCSMVRVCVVGVKDLRFPDAVDNVSYSLNEYVVYVPEGQKVLRYNDASGSIQGSVNFEDWGLDIESKKVYSVTFDSENHLRSAVFVVQPASAQLIFNGENVPLDDEGMASVDMPIGSYSYSVTNNGYEPQTGNVELTEDEISTVTNVSLQEHTYPVAINVFPDTATVFIDNVPYKAEDRKDLQLSEGKHNLRVTATNYIEESRVIDVKSNLNPIHIALKENKTEVVKHKDERTRTKTSVRPATYFSLAGEMYDKNKYYGFDYGGKIGLNFLKPLAGIITLKLGYEFGFMHLNDDLKFELNENLNDSATGAWLNEVPIQLGFSLPFGSYNRHLFTVLGGGYYRWAWVRTNEVIGYDSEKKEDKFAHNDVHDYGLRFTAMVDFRWFGIAGEYSRSLNGRGNYFGIKLAYKMNWGSTSKY